MPGVEACRVMWSSFTARCPLRRGRCSRWLQVHWCQVAAGGAVTASASGQGTPARALPCWGSQLDAGLITRVVTPLPTDGLSAGQGAAKLGAGGDIQLGENLAQVVLDRAGGQE